MAAARSRRAAASEYVVSVPRVAGAEPLRRQACAAPGGTPPRAAPGQGALATGVTTATITILHYIQRVGRGAHRSSGASEAPEQHSAGHRVVRRAGAVQPRAERGVARELAGARLAVPGAQGGARHAALLPVQDVRLQVPVLLLRAQAPQALPHRGARRRGAGARALHLHRQVNHPRSESVHISIME